MGIFASMRWIEIRDALGLSTTLETNPYIINDPSVKMSILQTLFNINI